MNLPEGNNHLPGGPFEINNKICIYTMGDTKCYHCGECGKKSNKCIINQRYICKNCNECEWE